MSSGRFEAYVIGSGPYFKGAAGVRLALFAVTGAQIY
jgi:hypothetical protein